MKRLGGWWRLWIVISVAYVALVVFLFANTWPSIERISHGPWLEYRLQPSSMALVNAPVPSMEGLIAELRDADRDGDVPRAQELARRIVAARDNPALLAPVVYKARNGHSFNLPPGTTAQQVNALSQDYERVLVGELEASTQKTTRELLAAAAIPPLLLLLVGLAFTWVRRGFSRA